MSKKQLETLQFETPRNKLPGLFLQVDSPTKLRSRPPSVAGHGTVAAVTWEDYVHMLLVESGHVAHAAIHRLRDGKLLAATDDICMDRDQVNTILRGFNDQTVLRIQGIWLCRDLWYTLTRVTDGRVMVGRNAATGNGCVLYKTNFCLIVGVYEEGNHPGGCYSVVSKLGDFLVESGF